MVFICWSSRAGRPTVQRFTVAAALTDGDAHAMRTHFCQNMQNRRIALAGCANVQLVKRNQNISKNAKNEIYLSKHVQNLKFNFLYLWRDGNQQFGPRHRNQH